MKRPEIILVIASSLDGRIAFPQGGETHLGSEYDKQLLNKSLKKVPFFDEESALMSF